MANLQQPGAFLGTGSLGTGVGSMMGGSHAPVATPSSMGDDHSSSGTSPMIDPGITPSPDLSHLTVEERAIISNVMHRHQSEESREVEFLRRKQMEVVSLENQIREKTEFQKKAGVELNSTCQICLKTKFADGIGHKCNYCGVRCCARCGGKVTMRSRITWVCVLCRKKQEILIKTGTWIGSGKTPGSTCGTPVSSSGSYRGPIRDQSDPIMQRIEDDMRFQRFGSEASTPKASHSAAVTPSASSTISSLFSRALSIAGTPTPSSPSGQSQGRSRSHLERGSSLDRPPGVQGEEVSNRILGFLSPRFGNGMWRQQSLDGSSPLQGPSYFGGHQTPTTLPTTSSHQPASSGSSILGSIRVPSLVRRLSEGGETWDNSRSSPRQPFGKNRTNSKVAYSNPRGRLGMFSQSDNFQTAHSPRVSSSPTHSHGNFAGQESSTNVSSYLQPRLTSYGHESVSAPEDMGGKESYTRAQRMSSVERSTFAPRVMVSDGEARDRCPPLFEEEGRTDVLSDGQYHHGPSLLDAHPIPRNTTQRRKMDHTFRNDSLSSDQSECVRPPPPKPHRHKRRTPSFDNRVQHHRRASFVSSSDDEIRSTPEYTSCGEEEMESESISEKEHIYIDSEPHAGPFSAAPYQQHDHSNT
ncbi:hypothetical protein TCAL_16226 [Tigriopus californicus]|uniref:RabBD domain-containing protein n=1 Tax=Tigriopus californicus TaxID=6832 RepID=A0A553P4C5_TIGCA|nr:hypothetical protein TCAL_16226 [Tigriopus californicus]